MSKRNECFNNLVDTISALPTRKIGKVSIKPIDFAKLGRQSFPVIQVSVNREDREDITMQHKLCTMYVDVTAYVKGESKSVNTNKQVNDILELVEEALEVDRTRGKSALITELREVQEIDESAFPIVSQTQTYVIQYYHDRGNS